MQTSDACNEDKSNFLSRADQIEKTDAYTYVHHTKHTETIQHKRANIMMRLL